MKTIFDYLPFFIVALFAVTLCFPKVFAQEIHRFGSDLSIEQAIEQVKPAPSKLNPYLSNSPGKSERS
ncbi:MAG: hypothetical protein IGR93_06700 [Hydrococcus sp. C42_A2020_068]|uniref:hypothetical protein n=1 Tax=Pleurocapsa sp. PCC 7327 TaxID=118163 RepID=UPI0002D649ED|nr:hypothetical protein [Pleurocapsa sp. PCC 7327]MBF2019786.1 hypothetical protein [Hydrococcus sp. C42_A2020_068]